MASLNKLHLIGNLTRDPELRYTPKGAAVVEFAIAVNRKYTTESGEKKEEVTYIDCTAWAKVAEVLGQHAVKGSPLYLEGRLQTDQWEDKATGQKKSRLKVVVEQFQFLGSKPAGSTPNEGPRRPDARQAPRQEPVNEPQVDGDDIPF